VDHLFLLFGLVESLEPDFFADRMFPALAPGDFNADGNVDELDYTLWKSKFGSTTHLAADGNMNGVIDAGDYSVWRDNLSGGAGGQALGVPEPAVAGLLGPILLVLAIRSRLRRTDTAVV
jgi:hypothetical protein